MSGRSVLLALRALGLGDLLTSVPALRALARAFPDHRLVLATPRALWPIVGLTDAVDGTVDASGLGPLRVAAPAIAVNLHGRGPQSHRTLLATRPSALLAFGHPDVPASADGPAWTADEHEVARWCRLVGHYGIEADPADLALRTPSGVPPDPELTVVHPGAGSEARRWPAERWAEVAAAEARGGRRVVVTGSARERPLALRIAAGAALPAGAVLAGRTDAADLAALVHGAGLVLSGDTGVAHLATAFGTPSVVLFGPTSPARWGPPPDRAQHVALWAGSTGDPHATTVDPGLLRIGVDQVLEAAERARAATAAPRSEAVPA